MKTKGTEKLVALIWQRNLVTELVADTGEQPHVIHPGRTSNTSGRDFQDAIFTINGKRVRGDIEIHVKSSQWHSHGHHRDPKYNNIALHIVWWHDSRSPTVLQNGKAVPTICLSSSFNCHLDDLNQYLNLSSDSPSPCPGVKRHPATEGLSKSLTTAGKERFTIKMISFRKAITEEEQGQVLFRGIARAVGYAQNAAPCEELASRLPLGLLERIEPESHYTRQALILGTAGLLPSQRHRTVEVIEAKMLEAIWQSTGITETMKETDWCFYKVRPGNFPTRRLIALSYLIARYHKTGLLHGILKLVKKAPPKNGHRWLERGLTVASQGYWVNHLDFGILVKRGPDLLGREKASEIAINTILPFACAYGEVASQSELQKKAAEIYRYYPKPGDNELTRYMKQQLLLKTNARLSACQQQGLIHIFKTHCRYRSCTDCPVALNQS